MLGSLLSEQPALPFRLPPPPPANVAGLNRWLSSTINVPIEREFLALRALTHPTIRKEMGYDSKQLEWIGDAALAVSVDEWFIRAGRKVEHDEHDARRPHLQTLLKSNAVLRRSAKKHSLHSFASVRNINYFRGESKSIADLVESIAGAILLDSGSIERVQQFLFSAFSPVKSFKKLQIHSDTFLPQFKQKNDWMGQCKESIRESLKTTSFSRFTFGGLHKVGHSIHVLLNRDFVVRENPEMRVNKAMFIEAQRSLQIVQSAIRSEYWKELVPETPFSGFCRRVDYIANDQPTWVWLRDEKIRFCAVLGATYLDGGMDAVIKKFGTLYQQSKPFQPPQSWVERKAA